MPTDTFTTTDASDGGGAYSGATYPPSTTFTNNDSLSSIYASRQYNGAGTYYLDNCFVSFDTSTLDDSVTVTAAELEVVVTNIVETDNLSVVGEYYAWDGSTAGSDITSTDTAGAFDAIDITTMAVGVETIPLTGLSNISKTGTTGIRIKVTKRAADAAPTGFNYIEIAGNAHATQPPPTLRVTYGATSTQTLVPDADVTTTGWTTAPLYSKLNDASDATVITATAS